MPAKCKSDLLTVTDKEFVRLATLIETIDEATALRKHDEDTSIKDVVAHRAHWIDLFLAWYADGQAGKTVFFPAKGYKWNDLKRYNADLRASQCHLDWPHAVASLKSNHDRLRAFIHDLTDDQLYRGPMKGAHNKWTTGRWAEAAGASHYRSASKFLRTVMRGQEQQAK